MKFALGVAVLLIYQAAGELAQCIEGWNSILGAAGEALSAEKTVYGEMFTYSGFYLNDLGRFHMCKKVEQAKYVVFEVARRPWVAFAFCGPASCTKSDYYELLKGVGSLSPFTYISTYPDPISSIRPRLSASPLSTITVHFPTDYIDAHSDIHGGAIAMLIFIVLLLALCLTATVVDLVQRNRGLVLVGKSFQVMSDESTSASELAPKRLPGYETLLCFSLYSNLLKLLQPVVSRTGENFSSLNGVRVLSIGWVILGHTYAYRVGSSPIRNILDIPEIIDKPKFAIVYGAFYAVDTFFWMGGFLLSYMMVKELKAKDRLNWFMVYFHRFWRLLPLFMFITFLVWAFQGYAGDGPMWFKADDSSENCADYWWTNLIFLNNFIPNGKRAYCIVVGWYMANDMQFYVISPPILFVYAKFTRAYGWIAVVLLCAISVITSWEIAETMNLNMVLIAPNNSDYMWYYYVKPYCRVAPYALGLACGFIMHEIKQFETSRKPWDTLGHFLGRCLNHPLGAWVSFFFGVFLVTLLIFVQYDSWKHGDLTFAAWSHAANVQFIAWNRLGYAFGISFLLLPVLLGRIPIVNWFLSLAIWSPFAKLTFSVYLIHLSIVDRMCLGAQTAYYIGDLQVLMDLLTFTCLSYLVACCISLTVESPVMMLEKVLFHRPRRQEAKKIEE